MKAVLWNGRTLTRRVELLPDRAGFKVTSELTGKGRLVMRVHPSFNIGPSKSTALFLYHGDKKAEISLSGQEKLDSYFSEADCPTGKWGFVTKVAGKDVTVLNTFDADQIDFCYVNMRQEEKRLNLEQWSKPQNDRTVITNTYEFVK